MSKKSLEEQIEDRIRRDQAILQSNDETLSPDDERDGGKGDGVSFADERSGCRSPLILLAALTATIYLAARALATFL